MSIIATSTATVGADDPRVRRGPCHTWAAPLLSFDGCAMVTGLLAGGDGADQLEDPCRGKVLFGDPDAEWRQGVLNGVAHGHGCDDHAALADTPEVHIGVEGHGLQVTISIRGMSTAVGMR